MKPSVVEVLLEIAKFCDVYLMERVLDDESEASAKEQHFSSFDNVGAHESIALWSMILGFIVFALILYVLSTTKFRI